MKFREEQIPRIAVKGLHTLGPFNPQIGSDEEYMKSNLIIDLSRIQTLLQEGDQPMLLELRPLSSVSSGMEAFDLWRAIPIGEHASQPPTQTQRHPHKHQYTLPSGHPTSHSASASFGTKWIPAPSEVLTPLSAELPGTAAFLESQGGTQSAIKDYYSLDFHSHHHASAGESLP